MFKTRIIIRVRYTTFQKQSAKMEMENIIRTRGIVISRAKTAKEICETANYNRAVELPICGCGKLNKKIEV